MRHWLHQNPDPDLQGFFLQVAQAEWLETRYWETMSKVMGGKK